MFESKEEKKAKREAEKAAKAAAKEAQQDEAKQAEAQGESPVETIQKAQEEVNEALEESKATITDKNGVEYEECPKPVEVPSSPEDNMLIHNLRIIDVAEMCHEANRAWCEKNNDRSQKSWLNASIAQRVSCIEGVKSALKLKNPTPAAMHNLWMKHKAQEGWTYGELKNEEEKTHPCMVAHHLLPWYQQVKDRIFLNIVLAFKKED